MAEAATSLIFVATNTCFSRQNTYIVATKECLSRQNIILSRQAYFCRDKHVFDEQYACCDKIFCCDKHNLVATKVLSRQVYFCRDTRRVLSRQKLYSRQLPPMIINTIPLHCILCGIASGKVLINTIPLHCILYDNDCIV